MAILKVKDENGNIIPIPAIQGKSAYQYAKEGGYKGTEQEFAQLLNGLDNEIETHNQDELAHPDIREEISQLAGEKVDESQLTSAVETALSEAKASGAFDGTSVTITNISESTADGGSNVVTFSNGSTLTVKNGSIGSTGAAGKDGADGKDGKDGKDYVLTAADKEEIASYVQVIYPDAHVIYGDVADDGTITIYGTLAAGEYALKYEGEDGISTGITTIEVRAKTYTNALPSAIDLDGTPYNDGKGYKTGYRLNSNATETANESTCVTGFIPIKPGDIVYLDGIVMQPNGDNPSALYMYLYKTSFEKNGAYFRADVSAAYAIEKGGMVLDANGNVIQMTIGGNLFDNWNDFDNTQTAYLRFVANEINDKSVVSINNPIV